MKKDNKNVSSILLINDMAGYGKVSLSVMFPILSHMRYQTFNLPTALVSNTLDYGKFDILDTTEYMKNTIRVWDELGFTFDAICTGLIVSEEQAKIVSEYCALQKKERGTPIFVDPVMGDDGKLYNGVTEKTVSYMQKLCSVADVIVPNITEACFIAGVPYKEEYTDEDIDKMVKSMRDMGAKSVVVTSCNLNGTMCTVVNEGDTDSWTRLDYVEIPVMFPGTGDIFSALVLGRYMRSGDLTGAVKMSMTNLEHIIAANVGNEDKYKGIPIEHYLDEVK